MSNQETNVDISKYKKLDEITHTLLRPARYIGSINPVVANTWFFRDGVVAEGTLTSSPAFHKLFDEIISNSADHSRTPEGKNLTEIDVQVQPETGLIIVTDNGGIPVVLHPEYGQYIPEMIFGELRSGSNFDDNEDSLSTGQNGEGASLVNIFSEMFKVQTIHNGKMFEQVFKNHMTERSTPEICDIVSENGTTITYKPDLKILNAHFDEDTLLLLERRCYEIAFTNPHLKVWFNTKLININNFETFVNSFDKSTVDISQDRWNVAVGLSKTGFQHISYVNSTASFDGGTHVDYVSEKIVEAVRSHIEKKTKQQIRPSDIKNNLRLFIDCKINNPRYNSQTKEKLITAPNQFGSQFKISDKQLKALLASPMIESIIEWAKRKKELEDARSIEEQAKAVRKNGFYDIPKYRPATSKQREDCILFLTEGDSALKPLGAASNPKVHGLFPLRGKPENCFAKEVKAVLSQEILYVMSILNLKLGQDEFSDMRYQKVVIATDFDLDGMHIRGLLVLFFKKFFPELLKAGRVQFFNTPNRVVTYKNKEYDFYDDETYFKFIEDKPSAKTKYCKGLGSHSSEKIQSFLVDPACFVTVNYEEDRDDGLLNLVFDPTMADDRKTWVGVA